MAIRLNASQKAMLLALVPATALAPVYVAAGKEAEALSNHNLALFDRSKVDQSGNVAGILTEAGQEKAKSYAPTDPSRARGPAIDPDTITIDDDVPMPEFKARGGSGARAVYPFEKMERVGQSFFIPSVEQTDEAVAKSVKRVNSSITSHNSKLRKAYEEAKATNPNAPAAMVFKAAEDAREGVKGVRVWRTA